MCSGVHVVEVIWLYCKVEPFGLCTSLLDSVHISIFDLH